MLFKAEGAELPWTTLQGWAWGVKTLYANIMFNVMYSSHVCFLDMNGEESLLMEWLFLCNWGESDINGMAWRLQAIPLRLFPPQFHSKGHSINQLPSPYTENM